jgi:hypothetical protein
MAIEVVAWERGTGSPYYCKVGPWPPHLLVGQLRRAVTLAHEIELGLDGVSPYHVGFKAVQAWPALGRSRAIFRVVTALEEGL